MRSNMSAIRRPGAALDLGQHEGRDQPPDAAAVDREDLHPRAKTRDPPDLRASSFRHAGRTMTHLPKKLLLLGTVACALGAAQPAAAQVQPAGTGEPLYTNSTQNTQWFEWPATQRRRRLPGALRLLREQRARRQPDAEQRAQRRQQRVGQLVRRADAPARRPVRHLRPGPLLAARRLAVLPRRPELVLDGHDARPPRLHDDRPLEAERRRSQLAGGAAATKDAKIPIQVGFSDDVAGPFPANFLCFQFGGTTNICDASAGFIYGYNSACSVPGSARQVDDVHLHRRLRRGRQPGAGRARCGRA